ncbi:hypothetical protein JCM4020_42460 [Streptomyces coelicolor]|nr:hypothetical protein JCM4020_42460 [Streptomyces coelicolor]
MQLALGRNAGPGRALVLGGTLAAAVPGEAPAAVLHGSGLPPGTGRTALARHLRRAARPGVTVPGAAAQASAGPDVTGTALAVTE